MKKKKLIIVGGGTAGLVAARKLSQKYDIEIFEKSAHKKLPLIYTIPLMIGFLFRKKNKYIHLIHLPAPRKRKVPYFVSNILGGSSVINGCVHVFGSLSLWQKILDNFSLDINDLKSSYNKIYSKRKHKNSISISNASVSKLDESFTTALEELGIPKGNTEFANTPSVGPIVNTVNVLFRSSVCSLAFKSKIKIKLNTNINNLVIDGADNLVGVSDGHENYYADIVVLCAGVIGTNELLLKPTLDISSRNYKKSRFEAVGPIADHTNLRINVKSAKSTNSLNEISSSFFSRMNLFINHVFGKATLMQGTGATSAVNLDLDNDGEIDTRINLLRFYESGRTGAGTFPSSVPGFSLSITIINPKSRGNIVLKNGFAEIDPGYLSDNEDIKNIKKALLFSLKLFKNHKFHGYVDEILEYDEIKKNMDNFISNNVYSGYHLIGGTSKLVGKNFNVKNMPGLYICDASILEQYPASNIHASVVLLADLFAKKLLLN